jgi:SNF2 family DNA or RNA helicase
VVAGEAAGSGPSADPGATARLRAVTQPFILRRVKTDRDIIGGLPAKPEMEVVCGLTRERASLYQAVVDDMLGRVAESDGMERRGLVLATMTRLSCPALVRK